MQQQAEAPEVAERLDQEPAARQALKLSVWGAAALGCESPVHAEWQRSSGGLFTTCPMCPRGFAF